MNQTAQAEAISRKARLLNRARATQLMREAKVDAVIASSKEDVEYVTSFHSLGHWLIPSVHMLAVLTSAPGDPISLVAPIGELDVLADQGSAPVEVFPYGQFFYHVENGKSDGTTERRITEIADSLPRFPTAAAALLAALHARGLTGGTIGLDEAGLRGVVGAEIKDALGGFHVVPGYDLVQRTRMIKTEEEIVRLEHALHITEIALQECLDEMREGMTERDVISVYEQAILEHGGRPIYAVVGFGSRSAYPNAIASDRRLVRGDLVRFDIGCSYESYCADTARIASFGAPESKAIEYYQALLDGEQAAIDNVGPGVKACDVFEAAVAMVRKTLPHYQRNHVGHGIGIEFYDPPLLAPNASTELAQGMVVNVETPYYELGWAGLQVEDTLVVTESGNRLLNHASRQLIVL